MFSTRQLVQPAERAWYSSISAMIWCDGCPWSVAGAVHAQLLLAIHGALGVLHEVAGLLVLALVGGHVDGDAEGGGDRDLLAVEPRAHFLDALAHALGERLRSLQLRLAQENGEFVAADAGHHVGPADDPLQHLRDAAQHLVPGGARRRTRKSAARRSGAGCTRR